MQRGISTKRQPSRHQPRRPLLRIANRCLQERTQSWRILCRGTPARCCAEYCTQRIRVTWTLQMVPPQTKSYLRLQSDYSRQFARRKSEPNAMVLRECVSYAEAEPNPSRRGCWMLSYACLGHWMRCGTSLLVLVQGRILCHLN